MKAWLILLLSPTLFAVPVMECKSKGDGLQGTFRLAEANRGNLELWAGGTRYQCPLKVSAFDAMPGGLLSQVILKFERQACKPAMSPTLAHKFFDDVRLRVISSGVTARARTQWLRFEQPDECAMKKLDWKKLLAWSKEFKKN